METNREPNDGELAAKDRVEPWVPDVAMADKLARASIVAVAVVPKGDETLSHAMTAYLVAKAAENVGQGTLALYPQRLRVLIQFLHGLGIDTV
jgi:hypothetical protein